MAAETVTAITFNPFQYMYDDVDVAVEAVRNGKVIGVVYFPENYTESARQRALKGQEIPDEVLEFGEIKVWLDMTSTSRGTTSEHPLNTLKLLQITSSDRYSSRS